MSKAPTTAMILAAGLGKRMLPLTLNTPKPLLKVAGKRIIDYGFEALVAAGTTQFVVNKHYLPDQIASWAAEKSGFKIRVSDETDQVLETGGGINRALPLLGSEPFFVLNSDCFWTENGEPALQRLASLWDETKMDCLLLLCPPSQTTGYDGTGDFEIASDGRLTRNTKTGLAYIGAYIVHPRLFTDAPIGKFSMNILWDRAISQARLFGLAHHGHWLHVGTPEALQQAETYLAK